MGSTAPRRLTRRLAHVIVGSAREAPHPVGLSCPSGQDDHRQIRIDPRREPIGGTHPVEQVEPAAGLEREVQQHQARPPYLDGAKPLPRTRRAGHTEAVSPEVPEEKYARGRVVLDDQDQAFSSMRV